MEKWDAFFAALHLQLEYQYEKHTVVIFLSLRLNVLFSNLYFQFYIVFKSKGTLFISS